jgi:putative ABC transport system permease protein
VDVDSINRVAEVSQAIDAVFRNSLAETLTETERAFQIGFVKQTEAILISIRIVSFVVIFIILAVMANTMAMTARERLREYATLKAIGFSPGYVARLILGESVVIALIGGAIAIGLTPPVAARLAVLSATLFPSLIVSVNTVILQALAALLVGVLAALLPMRRAAGVSIVNGLRALG